MGKQLVSGRVDTKDFPTTNSTNTFPETSPA